MKQRFGILLFAVLLLVGMALAGCNNSSSGTPKDSGGTKQQGKPKVDTLVYGRGGDSVSLDPAQATDGESFKVTDNIY
ncbi:MAG: ABC transporter substrate-binding protein, partial [Bacillota bacterium]|nr:ABC transporter substrate-binding protein [Bacillota bacterium]